MKNLFALALALWPLSVLGGDDRFYEPYPIDRPADRFYEPYPIDHPSNRFYDPYPAEPAPHHYQGGWTFYPR